MTNRLSIRRSPAKDKEKDPAPIHEVARDDRTSSTGPTPPPGGQPFVVLAGWDYIASSSLELSFVRGEALAILTTKHEIWWEAKAIGNKRGFVPSKYLLLAPTGPAPQIAALPPSLTLTDDIKENEIEYVLVEIKDKEGIDINGLAYEVLVGLPGGKVRAKHKRFSDFKALAAELLARVFPVLSAPPSPALVQQTHDLAATSAEGAKQLSGETLGDYLQSLVSDSQMVALLAAWLFPGEGLCPELLFLDAAVVEDTAAAGAAAALAAGAGAASPPKGHRPRGGIAAAAAGGGGSSSSGSGSSRRHHHVSSGQVGQEYIVLYTWAPEAQEDLELLPGDRVLVVCTHPDGWWYGKSQSTGATGYFPRNFVQRCEPVPAPPDRVISAAIPAAINTAAANSHHHGSAATPPGSPPSAAAAASSRRTSSPPAAAASSHSKKSPGGSYIKGRSRSPSPGGGAAAAAAAAAAGLVGAAGISEGSSSAGHSAPGSGSPEISPINKLAKAMRKTIGWGGEGAAEDAQAAADDEDGNETVVLSPVYAGGSAFNEHPTATAAAAAAAAKGGGSSAAEGSVDTAAALSTSYMPPVSPISTPGRRGTSPERRASPGGGIASAHASASPPGSPGSAATAAAAAAAAAATAGLLPLLQQPDVPFSLRTLEAFDDLLDLGVAVEMMGAPADEAAAPPAVRTGACREGTRVVLHCQAFAWDGASNCMRRYAATSRGGTPLSFVVGAGHVPAGLDDAIQRLSPGHCACIIGTPRLAYGEAGLPPHVPKNSHLVWRVEVLEGGGAPAHANTLPEGPPLLLLPRQSKRSPERASASTEGDDDAHTGSSSGNGISSSSGSSAAGAVSHSGMKRPQLVAASPSPPPQARAMPASVSIAEAADTDALLAKFALWNAELGKGGGGGGSAANAPPGGSSSSSTAAAVASSGSGSGHSLASTTAAAATAALMSNSRGASRSPPPPALGLSQRAGCAAAGEHPVDDAAGNCSSSADGDSSSSGQQQSSSSKSPRSGKTWAGFKKAFS